MRSGRRWVLVAGMTLVSTTLGTACGGDAGGDADGSSQEAPVVMESPHVRVLVGSDTVDVWTPTVFSYFGAGPGDGEPSPTGMEAGRDLQESLAAARAGFMALGVRVVSVTRIPVPLGIAAAVERDAGPALVEGGIGFLLVHPRGRIRRLERGTGGTTLVCAAARLFELPPPTAQGYACGA